MILSDRQVAKLRSLESALAISRHMLNNEERSILHELTQQCPQGIAVPDYLHAVIVAQRTDPPVVAVKGLTYTFGEQNPAADASGMREVQARIRQIIKAEPGSGIYMLMLKCYDDPVCKAWYKTSPWLLRVQITNAIRTIIDAEEADVLGFLSGAPVAPSDF